jgi:hypothetical protein
MLTRDYYYHCYSSGYSTPAPFPLDDITALLPCDEVDFAFGIMPLERAALQGTPPATANPALASDPERCLFATLIQAHNLWGQVARRACRPEPKVGNTFAGAPPWDPTSEFACLTTGLREWEERMPARHKWSVWNLRGWRAESVHLAYLAIVMVLRLSNIVVRRIYLDDLITALGPTGGEGESAAARSTTTTAATAAATTTVGAAGAAEVPASAPAPTTTSTSTLPGAPDTPPGFWTDMSHSLFANVLELHEQIDAYFSMRSKEEGFPAILVFCVYICGSLASYLWRYPHLCEHIAGEAEEIALKSLQVLTELHKAWPTSTRWQQGLQKIATPMSAQDSPAPSRTPASITTASSMGEMEPVTEHHKQSPSRTGMGGAMNMAADTHEPQYPPGPLHSMAAHAPDHRPDQRNEHGTPAAFAHFGAVQMDEFPSELFDAELTSFLTGNFHYGLENEWDNPPMT